MSARLILIVTVSLLVSCTSGIIESDSFEDKTIGKLVFDTNLNKLSDYFVVFGDLQAYTLNRERVSYYDMSIKWIEEQSLLGVNITDILQVGDITESNSESQWKLFNEYTYDIATWIPYFACTGNHDYSWVENSKIAERKSTRINSFAHFPLVDSKIEAYFESNSLENYVGCLSDKRKTRLLVLEFGPRKEVLKWASDYVVSHPDERFILMTHEWLTRYSKRISKGSYAEMQFSGYSSYSTPEEIWEYLVKPNNNIVCVLCGHNGFAGKVYTENDFGRVVPQILFNLQYQENGGNGYVQLWEFRDSSDFVSICVYDTINRNWVMSDSTAISFRFM